jgi:hypothetical protein
MDDPPRILPKIWSEKTHDKQIAAGKYSVNQSSEVFFHHPLILVKL